MIPIFKTGEKLTMSNFKPVSLLITLSKIFEKIIYTRIYALVFLHKILANEQYGFRSGPSVDNTSYALIQEVLSAMNNKSSSSLSPPPPSPPPPLSSSYNLQGFKPCDLFWSHQELRSPLGCCC